VKIVQSNQNKIYIISLTLVTAMGLKSCKTMEESLQLALPKNELAIVQQIPENQKGRGENTLYLPPRSIRAEEFNSPVLGELIDRMYRMMVQKSGVGIAANQIGKRLQVFIIEAKSDNPRYKVLGVVPKQVFINPLITKVSSQKKNFWHGCLSAEGKDRGNVATYDWIEYQCQNEKGEIITGRLEGFAAVIFQHEFKHLMNGTYLDVAQHFLSKTELDHEIETNKTPFFEIANDTLPLLIHGYTVGETLEQYHLKNN
jgi:peptide deformylase